MSSEIPIPAPLSATPIAPASFVFSVLQGLIGPPGLAGAAGVAGAAGTAGAAGANGSAGVAGATGTTGAAGTAGAAGLAGAAGVAGAAGLTGATGLTGPTGPAGAAGGATGPAGPAGAGVVGILTSAPGTGLTAATGNGVADDTSALAAIVSTAQTNNVPVLLPTGLYQIAAPLVLSKPTPGDISRGATSDLQAGFVLRGLTGASLQTATTTGNMIHMTGTSQDALLQIGAGACIGSRIESISLDGGAPALATANGIRSLYDYWSSLSLVNCRIQNVGWAVWIDGALGGGNGEFVNAYNCNFSGRQGIYKNTSPSGQALIHTLTACAGGTDNGGTQFFMNDGQLNVFGWSSTQGAGAAANVFLRLGDTLSGRCNFVGGRCERVDTLISWPGGSYTQMGTVTIEGIDFPGMSGTQSLFTGGGLNSNYRFVIKRCSFGTSGPVAGPLINSMNTSGHEQIVFEDCDFNGWGGGYAAIATNPRITLVRCRYFDTNGIAHAL